MIVRKPGTQRALRPDHGDGVPAGVRRAAQADAGTGGRVDAAPGQMLYAAGRHHHRARGRDPCRATSPSCSAPRAAGANIIDRRRLSVHHRPRQDPRGQPGQRLGHVRQAPEDRRREDHRRRLAAGQDRVLHHALPHRRPGGEKNWRGEPTDPAGRSEQAGQAGLRHGRAAATCTPTATRAIDMFLDGARVRRAPATSPRTGTSRSSTPSSCARTSSTSS